MRRSVLGLGSSKAGTVNGALASLTPPAVQSQSCCGGSKADGAGSDCCGAPKGRVDWLLWGSLAIFALGIAAHFMWPGLHARIHQFGHSCLQLALKAWWGLLLGIVTVGIIGRVPRELVAAVLGRGGNFTGLLRAVGAGVLLDLCNHGILMVGMSLYKRGTSLGQTIAFLIASPWNSFSLTLILAALIGWKWMAVFIALSMVVALLTGWIVDRLVASGALPPNPHAVTLPVGYRMGPELRGVIRSLKPGWSNYGRLLREGLSGSTMVLRWVFFGFVLTATIQTLVADEPYRGYFGPTIAGLLLTLFATTLIEVCSEGSSPIAADLLTRAGAPGNAFTFLMAGAATDYTEIMSLRSTTGSWKMALALPLISTPQVLLIAWLLNRA